MKLANSDIKSILWSFKCVTDGASNYIESKKIFHPSKSNKAYKFTFNKRRYVILIDAETHNEANILSEIGKVSDGVDGQLLKNSETSDHELLYKGKSVFLFVCDDEQKKRLDLYLKNTELPEKSRSYWQKMIKNGLVSVDSKVILSPNYEVNKNQKITIKKDSVLDDNKKIDLPIIYLDDNVIVIDKPNGLLTHSKGVTNDEFTVADFFSDYTSWGLDTNRPGIVHRLDRDTSGVLIGARNPETASKLQKQFAERKTKKTYIAVVDGVPKFPEADINLPIKRSINKPNTFVVDASGKSALTHYRVLKTNGRRSLVELLPKTGRTHQLRVHMQYIGTPIHGDKFYNNANVKGRLYLHAKSLEITVPDGDRKIFESPTPKDFVNMVA